MAKILIVDDSAFTRGIHRQILSAEGYETVEAASGAEAIEAFERENPDLTMVDLLMPDMDGMEAVKKILDAHPDARIVVCSTDKQKARQQEAEAAGALAFLTKPVDGAKAARVLGDILNR